MEELHLPKSLPRAAKVAVGYTVDGRVYVLFLDAAEQLFAACTLDADVGQVFKHEVIQAADNAVLYAVGPTPVGMVN